MLAKRCDSVIAYEPDPRSRMLLLRNVEKLRNVTVSTHAVAEDFGEMTIHLAKRPNLTSAYSDGTKFDVKTLPLPECDFIKMDIEGSEVGVLRGALPWLIKRDAKILVEVHPQFYGEQNDFVPVLEALVNAGYSFKYVVNAKGKMDEFRSFKLRKRFKHYKHRAIFQDVPPEKVIPWSTRMPEDGLKIVRSFLLRRNGEDS
jgi:FkbM family methyltransferase